MALRRLEAERFRGLASLGADFDARYNLIVGRNASGKTSLLEALFFVGRGRSFRTRRLQSVIRQGERDFQLVGRVVNDGPPVILGLRASRGQTEIRVGGQPARSATELAAYFPPHVIDPEVHKLLEDGPVQRRKFVDWGVFHVEPTFLADWQRFHRALRQRNAALRAGSSAPVRIWDEELVAAGERLSALRSAYLARLAPFLAHAGRVLLDLDVTVHHQSGWPADLHLREAVDRSWDRDRRYGLTHAGPHRADVTVQVEGQAARDRVSRGQQKLLASAMTLAQLSLQESVTPGRTALLLDDPAAELDAERLERLLAWVHTLPVQLFVTSLRADLPELGVPGAMFHVEHGVLSAG